MKKPRTSGNLCRQNGCYKKPGRPYPYCRACMALKVEAGEFKICRFCGQPWEPKHYNARHKRGYCYKKKCLAKREAEIVEKRKKAQKAWWARKGSAARRETRRKHDKRPPGLPKPVLTERSCNYCGKHLPNNRRFNHKECIAHIERLYDLDFIYNIEDVI